MRIGKAQAGGCTPWFYPTKNTNMCDPWQTQIFLSAIMDGDSGGYIYNIRTQNFQHILLGGMES